MPQGIISFHRESISDMLQLPMHYRVVSGHYDPWNKVFNVLVESDELPETRAFNILPKVSPVYKRVEAKQGEMVARLVEVKVEQRS